MFCLKKTQSIKQFMGGRYWSRSIISRKVLENEWNVPERNGALPTPSDFVKTFMPKCGSSWQDTTLDSTNLKTQMLLSCEETFNRSVPDRQLGAIVTVNDVIKFFECPQVPRKTNTSFLSIDTVGAQDELPHNLSFPKTMTAQSSVPKRTRIPFQNFDSPKHANFLTKKEKEARKVKKQRHTVGSK